ncbi:Helicase conserved C-terminal domain-containing protein [Ruminococcaceae bacterium YRB3002]|nr:Helicase conserved C-terminal domain-containing protein [Ruminococcaceae bacterium YRB3002]
MIIIVVEKSGDSTIKLCGLSQLNTRLRMKLSIYVDAIKNATTSNVDSDVLFITFASFETHDVAGKLADLVDFLSANNVVVEFDSVLQELMDSQEEFENDMATKVETLKAIKSDTESINNDFDDFCVFCDKNLCIKLRDYQYKSAFLLCTGSGGFDFSVPGSGKTIITYATYVYLKQHGVVDSLFVIGPGSAYNAWFDEYNTCFDNNPDFENLAFDTTYNCRLYLDASPIHHREITFINFDKLRLLKEHIVQFLSNKNALLVIDEGHKIKNPNAAVTEAALEISSSAKARIILTGTPMPNGYEDLYTLTTAYSPYKAILPYSFSQLKAMTKVGATTNESNRLHESLNPFYSRISKKYLISKGELLPPEITIIECEMDSNQRFLYQQLNDFCGKISDDIDEDLLLNMRKAVLLRKMQISANPALLKKSIISSMDELKEEYGDLADRENSNIGLLAKADKQIMEEFMKSSIVRIVNSYENGTVFSNKNMTAVSLVVQLVNEGKKVLVWDIFVYNMTILRKMIEASLGMSIEMINGSVTGIERQNAIKRFRNGDSMVLLANPATLAESISLHKACQNAIYVNRSFNAAQFIQSKDRIHRINMPTGTTAHYYFVENHNSVDSAIAEKLNIKETRMLEILDADDITIGGEELEDTSIMTYQDIQDSYLR